MEALDAAFRIEKAELQAAWADIAWDQVNQEQLAADLMDALETMMSPEEFADFKQRLADCMADPDCAKMAGRSF
jgi:hypothetical protein